MTRTKKTARMSTGGRATRKRLLSDISAIRPQYIEKPRLREKEERGQKPDSGAKEAQKPEAGAKEAQKPEEGVEKTEAGVKEAQKPEADAKDAQMPEAGAMEEVVKMSEKE